MLTLIVDTETTGLCDMRTPYNEDTLKTTWPYITQFAWMVVAVDETGLRTVLEEYSCYIRPNYPGHLYSKEAEEVSGISYKTLMGHGKGIREVLTSFLTWLQKVDFVVSHNTTFDMKVIKAEMLRHGFTEHLRIVPWLDTVYYGGEYIKSRFSLRKRQFPKLGILYNHLTGKSAPEKIT